MHERIKIQNNYTRLPKKVPFLLRIGDSEAQSVVKNSRDRRQGRGGGRFIEMSMVRKAASHLHDYQEILYDHQKGNLMRPKLNEDTAPSLDFLASPTWPFWFIKTKGGDGKCQFTSGKSGLECLELRKLSRQSSSDSGLRRRVKGQTAACYNTPLQNATVSTHRSTEEKTRPWEHPNSPA